VTCCLLFTFFVGEVSDRGRRYLGVSRRASTRDRFAALFADRLGLHWRRWLALLAGAEVAVAWLLVELLLVLDQHTGSGPLSMAGMAATSNGSVPIAVIVLGLVLGVGLFGFGVRLTGTVVRWWTSPRACVYYSVAGYAIALLPVVRSAAAGSHLVLMAQLMLLLVIAPAALMVAFTERTMAGTGTRSSRGRRRIDVMAVGVVTLYLLVLFGWHLPSAHQATMADPGVDWLRLATSVAAGLALWAFLFSGARVGARLLALLAAGAGSGLLGIAFLVSPRPLFQMAATAPLGLGALTDQRLAGLVMMAIDLAVLLPVASELIRGLEPPGVPSRSRLMRSLPVKASSAGLRLVSARSVAASSRRRP
jgi:Cytochrome c oxidase caa3 assembly factor (Caa3_CtaG)